MAWQGFEYAFFGLIDDGFLQNKMIVSPLPNVCAFVPGYATSARSYLFIPLSKYFSSYTSPTKIKKILERHICSQQLHVQN